MKKIILLSILLFNVSALAQYDPTQPNQDWSLNSDYSCVYQSNKLLSIGDNTCSSNHLLKLTPYDANMGSLEIDANTTPTSHDHQIHLMLKAAAAGVSGIKIEANLNGFPSTNAIQTFTTLTGLSGFDVAAPNLFILDTDGSTGGVSSGVNVQKIGTGSALVAAVLAGTGTYPYVTLTGTLPQGPSKAWKEATGPSYTDVTTEFGSSGTNVNLFNAQNDYVYIGADATFYEIQVILNTTAVPAIQPVFQYSTASGWTTFSPSDGTSGFTRNGNISFDKATLVSGGWAARSVNGVSKYYIRIQRTIAVLSTLPVESTIFTADGAINQIDPQGTFTIQQIISQGSSTNKFGGRLQMTGVVTSHSTCNAANVGLLEMFDNGSNRTSMCVCERTAASTYVWNSVSSLGSC